MASKSIRDVKHEKSARKRKARKRRRVIALLVEILILMILLGLGYIMTTYGKLQLDFLKEEEIQKNEGVTQEGYTTIALFGGDSRDGELGAGTHTDTIMIVSIEHETKSVKVISVYRDLLTEQMDGILAKANSAYFQGGAQEAINMLNKNFDLAIEDYVTIDFKAFADVIELLGGIEATLTAAEADAMNEYIGESAAVTGKEAKYVSAGAQTLDGVQALTYARIRKNVGGDYARTMRQRYVLEQVVEKAKGMDLSTLNEIINQVFPQIATSFTLTEALGLAGDLFQYRLGATSGFVFEYKEGYVQGVGSVVLPVDLVKNVEELHQFLYQNAEYQVSDTVRSIAEKITPLS